MKGGVRGCQELGVQGAGEGGSKSLGLALSCLVLPILRCIPFLLNAELSIIVQAPCQHLLYVMKRGCASAHGGRHHVRYLRAYCSGSTIKTTWCEDVMAKDE